jgi:hypothetical protein
MPDGLSLRYAEDHAVSRAAEAFADPGPAQHSGSGVWVTGLAGALKRVSRFRLDEPAERAGRSVMARPTLTEEHGSPYGARFSPDMGVDDTRDQVQSVLGGLPAARSRRRHRRPRRRQADADGAG